MTDQTSSAKPIAQSGVATEPDRSGLNIGPLWLAPGIGYGNVATAIYASFTTIGLMLCLGFIQPYLLTEVLHIPSGEQGSVTGRLASLQEVVVIISISVMGTLSDQRGRRLLYVAGFVFLGTGYFLYPLADSVLQLALFRLIFAVGVACVPIMLSAIAIDYSQPASRGKLLGIFNTCAGLGLLFLLFVVGRSPARLEASGYDPVIAAQYTFWMASAACFVTAAVLFLGLKDKKSEPATSKPNPFLSIVPAMKAGLQNRKLALAYGAAFVGRGDLVIIGAFLPLWATQMGLEAGLTTGEALSHGISLVVINQTTALLFAYVSGYITDKFNTIAVLGGAFMMAGVGYFGMWLVGDPFTTVNIGATVPLVAFAIIPLAIGDMTIIVSANVLVGQEAPVLSRGTILGVFGMIGAIGIAVATFVGGEIFDAIGKTAPFAMMALLNFTIVVWASYVYLSGRKSTVTAS